MKNSQNFMIGLLLVTAVLLAAMVASTFTNTGGTAYADTAIKQGRYIMCTGAWSSTTDFMYILDIAARRVNVYYMDRNKGIVDIVDTVDLRQAFAS